MNMKEINTKPRSSWLLDKFSWKHYRKCKENSVENMHTDINVERVNTRPYSIGKSWLYEALFTDFHTFNPVPPKSDKDQLFITIPLRY